MGKLLNQVKNIFKSEEKPKVSNSKPKAEKKPEQSEVLKEKKTKLTLNPNPVEAGEKQPVKRGEVYSENNKSWKGIKEKGGTYQFTKGGKVYAFRSEAAAKEALGKK